MTTAENIVDFLMEHCGECGEDEPTFVPCPACGGDGQVLGQLGNLMHYRCRACGWDFSENDSAGQLPVENPGGFPQTAPPKANVIGDTTSMGIGGGGN